MTNISLKVNGASAVASVDGKITSGMVGLPVSIEFDDSWIELQKTAFFRVGSQVRKKEHIDEITTVPWEVLRNHGKPLEIGIEGRDEEGTVVIPTIWASVAMVYQGASGEIPAAPIPSVGDEPSDGGGVQIDDNAISAKKTWSSLHIDNLMKDNYYGYVFEDEFKVFLSDNMEYITDSVIDSLPIYNGEVVE